MSELSIQSFKESTSNLYQEYQSGFAERPRATRNLEELDRIINELEGLINQVRDNDQLRSVPSFVDSLETAVENLNLYKKERVEIEKAQANPLAVKGGEAFAKVTRLSYIYGRKFAGQNRATRDLSLLEDLIEEMLVVKAQIEGLVSEGADEFKEELGNLQEQIQLYQNEVQEIRSAQQSLTPEERVSLYAELANEQFRVYAAQFGGKHRVSRRPGLLSRMIKNLESYRKEMRAIQELPSVTSPTNTSNIKIVEENLNLYKEELDQIVHVRSNVSPTELADQLAVAANDVMAEYREHFAGQMRATRDLARLGNMCDALWDISRQMEELLRYEGLSSNPDNLSKVNENWTTYEREYIAVKEAIEANSPS